MTSAETRDDRKTEILTAASRALRRSGLPHLSYDTVAAEAGVSRQLVRYHFGTHEALILSLSDHLASSYRTALEAGLISVAGDMRLDRFLDFHFGLTQHPRPDDDRVTDAMMALTTASGSVRQTLRTQQLDLGRVVSDEIAAAYPDLSAQAADELSYLFSCLMHGHWRMVSSLGFDPNHARIAREAIDDLIRSYRQNGRRTLGIRVWKGTDAPEAHPQG